MISNAEGHSGMWSGGKNEQRKAVGCGTIALFMCALGLFALAGLLWIIWEHLKRTEGAQPNEIQGSRFYVIVFPKRDERANPIQRAVFLTLDDLTKDQFEVFIHGRPENMDATLFTAVPAEDREQHDIDGLNREIRHWGANTSWRRVEYFINREGYEGESVVKLTVYTSRGDRLEYLYRVTTGGRVIPVWHLIYRRI